MPLQDLPLEGEEKKILSSSPTIKSNDSSVEKVPDKEDQSVVKGKATQKPKILPLPNGPYYLLNDTKPKVVENLRNSKGQELSTVSGVALCRCGATANKPFCDGTHSVIRFSSKNDENKKSVVKDKRKNYIGNRVTIHDNRRVCSHAKECVNNLPSVFRFNSRPWIDANGASIDEIIQTIRKCPSGALSYSIDGVEYRDRNDREPLVTVSKDGPYIVTGGIELMGENGSNAEFGEGASKEHYTLCRCGASANKPFCDGTHNEINFKDEKN
jgi:CDGSH-type Zn-finger protein